MSHFFPDDKSGWPTIENRNGVEIGGRGCVLRDGFVGCEALESLVTVSIGRRLIGAKGARLAVGTLGGVCASPTTVYKIGTGFVVSRLVGCVAGVGSEVLV